MLGEAGSVPSAWSGRATFGIGRLVLALAVTVFLAGCSGGAKAATSTSIASVTSTLATTPSTAPRTTAVPTTVFVPRAFPTPSAAGSAIFAAWTKGDRIVAGAYAEAGQLDALFGVPPAGARNRGCDDGAFGGVANCFFGLRSGGGVSVGLSAAAGGGWVVATIDVNP